MNESPANPLTRAWFEYVRRGHGSRDERRALELGEPADAVHAAEQVREITAEGGARAVELVVALLNDAPDDQALRAVGAGPLEDLLADHWDDVIDEIEALARAGGPIRQALTSVYVTGDRAARLRPWMR